jgi:hypothetical protein
MIIIAASGMATGGRVVHHLKAFAPDPRNTILFSGFQAGGTLQALSLIWIKNCGRRIGHHTRLPPETGFQPRRPSAAGLPAGFVASPRSADTGWSKLRASN